MRNVLPCAVSLRHRRARFVASLAAFLMLTTPGFAQAPTNQPAAQQALMRIVAAMKNAAVADTKAYDEQLHATEVTKIVTLEGLTPSSAVLDHCDNISAMVDRANVIGGRYADYVALARKQGEIEVAAHELQPTEAASLLEDMAAQKPAFERRWAASADFAREAAGLCTVLARRHWRVGASGIPEIEEPDLTDARRLLASVQQAARQLLAVD